MKLLSRVLLLCLFAWLKRRCCFKAIFIAGFISRKLCLTLYLDILLSFFFLESSCVSFRCLVQLDISVSWASGLALKGVDGYRAQHR